MSVIVARRWRRLPRRRSLAAVCAFVGLIASAQDRPVLPQAPVEAPWQAVIDSVIDLSASAGIGTAPRELSALAWDPQARELVAASDRGRLFRYRLATAGEHLRAEEVFVRRLGLGDKPNPESLAWRDARPGAPGMPAARGELLMAGERGTHVWRLAPDGEPLGALDWPAAIAGALSAGAHDSPRHGVEAIAWSARHGLLAALQKPLKPLPDAKNSGTRRPRTHWVHAGSGARWGFEVAGPDSHLKAIEARPDGTLLLLERVRQDGDSRLHTVLRWIDPASCGNERLCVAPSLPMLPASIVGDDNVEGLACTQEGTCWLVNDGGAGGEQPTRLWQFRLVPRIR